LHETDRHFGYDPAYPLNPINPRNTCDTIREVFLPTIIK
jgi:hypothetical protein